MTMCSIALPASAVCGTGHTASAVGIARHPARPERVGDARRHAYQRMRGIGSGCGGRAAAAAAAAG